ncbi:MAG: MerR family transcriptional regulator [Desulfobacterales bacterium]|jgi:DNA-binding transcriptional MerR regulator|nr:MerR family transcriptional regulator [Desulfobacterales bacterium]
MKERSPSTTAAIPDKLYFKIGEVSRIAAVPAHVLRFWESEFPRIAPKRTDSGQRLYTRREVEMILEIKELLHGRRFTIEGARRHLRRRGAETPADDGPDRILDDIRAELHEIRRLLE